MIGRTIAHYEVLEKVGEGGMGVGYKTRDTQGTRLLYTKHLGTQHLAGGARGVGSGRRRSGAADPIVPTRHLPRAFPRPRDPRLASERSGSGEIWLADADGGRVHILTSLDADAIWNPEARWSPDGEWIHFEARRGGEDRTWRVPRDGGEDAVESAPRGRTDPDGRFRYFAEWTEIGATIRREPTGGGPSETIVDAANHTFVMLVESFR